MPQRLPAVAPTGAGRRPSHDIAVIKQRSSVCQRLCLARDFASNNTLPLLADVKQARRMFGGLCATIPDAGESR
jgi:hypothetical protein